MNDINTELIKTIDQLTRVVLVNQENLKILVDRVLALEKKVKELDLNKQSLPVDGNKPF